MDPQQRGLLEISYHALESGKLFFRSLNRLERKIVSARAQQAVLSSCLVSIFARREIIEFHCQSGLSQSEGWSQVGRK